MNFGKFETLIRLNSLGKNPGV